MALTMRSCSFRGGIGISTFLIASIEILSWAVAFLCFVNCSYPAALRRKYKMYSIKTPLSE